MDKDREFRVESVQYEAEAEIGACDEERRRRRVKPFRRSKGLDQRELSCWRGCSSWRVCAIEESKKIEGANK
jgi:hypothetical protein